MPEPKNYRLSPSKLSDYRDNPRGFWLAENARLARPRGIFPSLPGGMDKVLKTSMDLCRSEGTMPSELATLAEQGFTLFPVQSTLDKLRQWQSAPKWTDPETGCSMIFGIDDLLVDPNGQIVPLDYKTKAGLPDEDYGRKYYGLQLDCYRMLLEQAAGLPMADIGVLHFYSPSFVAGNSECSVDIQFDAKPVILDTDPSRALKVFREAVRMLRGPLPMAGPREEWDSYALNYSRLVSEHSRAAAA